MTPRQTYIIQVINQTGGIPREELQKKVETRYRISKPTLIRDLNHLIRQKYIRIIGRGRNTRYIPFSENPLLRFIELDNYFEKEPDDRLGAKKIFNFSVFIHLHNLFTREEIKKISEIKKNFASQTRNLPPDILKKELERFTIELSWKSSKIEGNTYTLLEAEALLTKNIEAPTRSKEETMMILNHKRAFEQILDHTSDFRKLSISLINQLHNTLIKNLNISTGLRKHPVGITGTVYRPLDNIHQIQEAMEKFITVVNMTPDTLEKALITSVMVPYIQPYADGNKRTGRMLTNAVLLAQDYYPLSYRSIDEEEFKKALILFYEQNNVVHIKRLFIDQLVFAYNTYFQ